MGESRESAARIAKMEHCMAEQEALLKQMNVLLDRFEHAQQSYRELLEYYSSEQRWQDLEAEEQGKLPENLCRGVLSEDGLYNMIGDYDETAIRMMELGLQMIKLR